MRAQARDANERELIDGLRLMGFHVERHYTPDAFDALVSRLRSPVGLRMEFKTATGKLTEAQEEALENGLIVVARSIEDAIQHCKKYL